MNLGPTAILSVANQKGGVGKTTTAVNIAANLASRGRRVLLIDLDAQGNATTNLGCERGQLNSSSYDLFRAESSVQPLPAATNIAGLDILPASMDLAGVDIELAGATDQAARLRTRLAEICSGTYHYVILDCPPSFGVITLNALAASDYLLIPLQCEFFALEGLAHLKRTVDAVRRAHNPTLALIGIALTMFDRRNSLCVQVAHDVRGFFGKVVLSTIIPRSVRLSEAPSHGMPIRCYDPRSAGAVAYESLTDELLDRIACSGSQDG